jgi:hypothetical protein
MVKVDIKKFITDRVWFGWYYWKPSVHSIGFWERGVELNSERKRKWVQRVDWNKVFGGG